MATMPTELKARRRLAREMGPRLRHLRLSRGLTQPDVSQAIAVNVTTVSRWERGDRLPSAADVVALAQLFRTSADEILGTGAITLPIPRMSGTGTVTRRRPAED